MTREQLVLLLNRVVELPEDAHRELVESVERIEARYVYVLDAEERAALARSREDVRLGRFASEEAVAAVFENHRER